MRLYVKLLIIFSIISLILMLPNLSAIISLMTLGFALPLLAFFPSVTYYLLASFPGVAFGSRTGDHLMGYVIVLLCIILASFLPIIPAQMERKNYESILQNSKIAIPLNNPPRTIEIIEPIEIEYAWVSNYKCKEICKSLIRTKQVDWIRIKWRANDEDKSVLYRVGKNKTECKLPGIEIADDSCALMKQDKGKKAELIIKVTNSWSTDQKSIFKGKTSKQLLYWRRYTATDNRENEQKLSYANWQQELNYPITPFLLIPHIGQNWTSKGIEIWRKKRIINPLNHENMLSELGYFVSQNTEKEKLEPRYLYAREYSGAPSTTQTSALLYVLNLPTKSKFNETQMDIIKVWLDQAEWHNEWTKERVRLVKRISRDPRLTRKPHDLERILRKMTFPE